MRYNYFCNAVFVNENLQFRVYEFVSLINKIIGMSNVFTRLNGDDKQKKKKMKAK